MTDHSPFRRNVLKGAAAATAFAAVGRASAQNRSDEGPRELRGQPVPEPGAAQSAGPIRPGRGTMLSDKVAVVTGAARGIGRAIAVEMAANGADVVAIDIVGPSQPRRTPFPQHQRISRRRSAKSAATDDGEKVSKPTSATSPR